MNKQQKQALLLRETDLDGAMRRFCGNEELYISCLKNFLKDQTVAQLAEAINLKRWDDAFTAAHALKGLAGNMGFIPLMHATGMLVVLIRGGREKEIPESMKRLNSCYRDIVDAIKNNFTDA